MSSMVYLIEDKPLKAPDVCTVKLIRDETILNMLYRTILNMLELAWGHTAHWLTAASV